MTKEEREQAIEQLEYAKALIEQDGKDYLDERDIPMLNMAIEALKAEPCEDAVSRKHLLSGIDELMQSPWFNRGKDDLDGASLSHYGYVERKEAVEIVRDLCVKTEPPVTPVMKKGEWLIPEGYLGYWICSNCLSKSEEDTAFCPNCGVKMEGESE